MSLEEPPRSRGTRPTAARLRVIDLASERSSLRPTPGDRKVRVLLVDDDDLFASLVSSLLEEAEDFEVDTVPRLSTALARLVRDRIDLVLANLNLPDSEGASTVRFLKRAAPDVPLIAISHRDNVQVALEAIREGADEYVVKGTFSVTSLVWLVRLVLEHHRRLLEERGTGYVDPLSGLGSLAALEVVGRHLLRVADRTGLNLGLVFLKVKAAPRGRWADWQALLEWVSDLLQRTLRRCDLVSRVGRYELAVLLISEEGHAAPAVTRIEEAIVAGGAGAYVRVGLAVYEREHPAAFDELLDRARAGAHRVLA